MLTNRRTRTVRATFAAAALSAFAVVLPLSGGVLAHAADLPEATVVNEACATTEAPSWEGTTNDVPTGRPYVGGTTNDVPDTDPNFSGTSNEAVDPDGDPCP
ncbi:hypothetical protein [Rhodococcus sp. HNM0569]|uniref:hypothetical protein n=1 Tax=Rhodococcus sp. HNM0569 TaxID=2716340 RepID=UPI001469B7E5|nr:hypothetical protein [Rhodococcus sp. HNM0569]NLU83288.1 hypothetical protein [Rhodococcus sp. HNM0569]